MGIFDNAKVKLSQKFTDETVRVVNYDLEETPESKGKEERKPRPKPQKPEKPAKPVKKAPKKKPVEDDEELELSTGSTAKRKTDREAELRKKRERLEQAKREREEAKAAEAERRRQEAAEKEAAEKAAAKARADEETKRKDEETKLVKKGVFLLDEDDKEDFLERPSVDPHAGIHDDVPDISVKEGRIQDVLNVMNVQPTFTIPSDVFIPEDLEDLQVGFDLQTPYGYDQGQVDLFVNQVRGTVNCFWNFLAQRNVDVAKLASMVDKLQVDANNLMYQAEAANGIALMPSSDTEELENQLVTAELTIKRLQQQLNQANKNGESTGLTDRERERYDALQEENADLRRTNDELQEEVSYLRKELAGMEERTAFQSEAQEQDSHGLPLPVPQQAPTTGLPLPQETSALPLPDGLPTPMGAPETPAPVAQDFSSYALPDSDSAYFLSDENSSVEVLNDSATPAPQLTYSDDDEEDALDRLRKKWENQ